MKSQTLKALIPLVAICLAAALLLGVFNLITEKPIQENSLRTAMETRRRLMPKAAEFEALSVEEGSGIDSCYLGVDEQGSPVGYVAAATVNGYGGEVVVTLGMNLSGRLTGLDVGGDNFSETAGLGALAKEPAFTGQYVEKTLPLTLVKAPAQADADSVEAISGATRTSTAVNDGVNHIGAYLLRLMESSQL